jgi:DNA-binding transcriptional MerR regulator
MSTTINEKTYSIGEVARIFGLSVPTIRYYDAEGLIPNLHRTTSGNRLFTKDNLETINMIGCLKKSGMSIKDIKTFISWCSQGDSTLSKRQEMFHQLKYSLTSQLHDLQSMLDVVNFKCRYYDLAVDNHSEAVAKRKLAHQQPDGLKLTMDD